MSANAPELASLPPAAVIMQMTMGYMVSQAITVAAKFKLADHLNDGAKTAEQLAELADCHAPSVYRLMRALVSTGVFQQDSENRFSNNPNSDILRSDHPTSLRSMAEMVGNYDHWNSHGNLKHSIKTGEAAFDFTWGMPVFPFYAEHPDCQVVFDAAMSSFTNGISQTVAANYDFSEAKTIADIGGGYGMLVSTILNSHPHLEGILFDQPQVVAGAEAADRLKIVEGDFFSEIPVEADIYLMKHIIHDWNDEQSLTILNNLSKSARSGTKLLLIECVVEEENVPSMSKIMDLNMMVMTGGKERTAAEYSQLLEKSGFKLNRVIQIPSPVQIVEAIKV